MTRALLRETRGKRALNDSVCAGERIAIIDASPDESKLQIYLPVNDKREVSTSVVAEFPCRGIDNRNIFRNFFEGNNRRGDRNEGGLIFETCSPCCLPLAGRFLFRWERYNN